MTPDPLSAARAQDAAIAEALFGHRYKRYAAGSTAHQCGVEFEPLNVAPEGEPVSLRMSGPSYYSSDPVAFEALLQEIGKRGLGEKYVTALSRVTPHTTSSGDWTTHDIWEIASAPITQKASACLAVLREATNG